MVVPCDICSGEGLKPYTGIHIKRSSEKIGIVSVRLFFGGETWRQTGVSRQKRQEGIGRFNMPFQSGWLV